MSLDTLSIKPLNVYELNQIILVKDVLTMLTHHNDDFSNIDEEEQIQVDADT
jgi:hypothetical protein